MLSRYWTGLHGLLVISLLQEDSNCCMQVANGCSEEQYKVIYKRPSDLSLKADVPVCCNVLICDIFDEGVHLPA